MKSESQEIKGRKSTGGGRTWYGKRETLTPLSPPLLTKLSFVTTYHPAVKNLKQILMEHWSLIRNQLLLKTIFQNIQLSLTKREHGLKKRLWIQKYNLKAIMWCDHESHMRIPCRSLYPLSNFKKVSKIWLIHLCLTSGRLVQVKIDHKSILALTIQFYH